MTELTLSPRFSQEVTTLHKLDNEIRITWHFLFIVCWTTVGLLVGGWMAYYFARGESLTIIHLQSTQIEKLNTENSQLNSQLNKSPRPTKFKPLIKNI